MDLARAAGVPASRDEPLAGFYRFLWTSAENDPARFAFLDDDLGGRRAVDMLRDHAAAQGLGVGSRVLDAGCGKGRQACLLANEFGCRVIALDLLAHNLRLAHARAATAVVAGAVDCVLGSLDKLPLRDAAVDLIWCTDMFNLLTEPELALSECARVLKPGGVVLLYAAVATEPLGAEDAARLCEPMGVHPATLVPTAVAAAAARAGLRLREGASTSEASSGYFEVMGPDAGRDVLRLARLVRARPEAIARLGHDDYHRLVALYRWHVYWLIGRLAYHIWILEK